MTGDASRVAAPSNDDRPITILMDHLSVGGGTTVAASLVRSWMSRGIPVEVVALGSRRAQANRRFPPGVVRALDARTHLERVFRLRSHLRAETDAGRTILCIGEYPALIALIVRAFSRRLSHHRIVIAEHQPHSLVEVLGRRRWPMGYLLAVAVRRIRRGAEASICLSEQQLRSLVEADLVRADSARVIPNPCLSVAADKAAIVRRAQRLTGLGAVRILTVGSLNAAKNHPLLLRAVGRLEARFTVTIVGGGDTESLTALASELRVGDRTASLGARSDVDTLMDEHDVFVLSSDYESFGLVVIEAIARGMPVIATACNESLVALAEEYRSLRIVPVGDEFALASAIHEHSGRAWDPNELARSAALITAAHDPERAAELHLRLFSELRTPDRTVGRGARAAQ